MSGAEKPVAWYDLPEARAILERLAVNPPEFRINDHGRSIRNECDIPVGEYVGADVGTLEIIRRGHFKTCEDNFIARGLPSTEYSDYMRKRGLHLGADQAIEAVRADGKKMLPLDTELPAINLAQEGDGASAPAVDPGDFLSIVAGEPTFPPVVSLAIYERNYPLMHGEGVLVMSAPEYQGVLIGMSHPQMEAGMFMGVSPDMARNIATWLLNGANEIDGGKGIQ